MSNLVKDHQALWEAFFKTPEGYRMGLLARDIDSLPDATEQDYRQVWDTVLAAMFKWLAANAPWN